MKIMWTGSDVLYLTFPKQSRKSKFLYFAGLYLFAKLADRFVEEHYVVSEHLIPELEHMKFRKKIRVLQDPPKLDYLEIQKKEHRGINVLYYCPEGSNQELINWVYGYDLFLECSEKFPDYRFIRLTGREDLRKIYPVTDFYLRPNRHDGAPRMIMECKKIGIPFYWSRKDPDPEEICRQLQSLAGNQQQ